MPTVSGSAPHSVLLSAAGRRVALLHILQRSMDELGIAGSVIASDITLNCSAMQAAGRRLLVPPVRDPQCLSATLQIIRDEHILLIVPTIDTELPFYASHASQFAALGCRTNISSPQTIEIAYDKELTHDFLCRHGLPTVQQWNLTDALANAQSLPYPLIIKPRHGSGSANLSPAINAQQLISRGHEPDLLVQTIAPGREYTVDVFVDDRGICRCAVPRLRLETRGGEVSKGVTVRNRTVIQTARRVAEALPGARGVLNVQIFHDERTGQTNIIEINPRFGGGYPLTHQAGAPMARWLLEEAMGRPCPARDDQWHEGVVMLRYDEAVFVNAQDVGIAPPAQQD